MAQSKDAIRIGVGNSEEFLGLSIEEQQELLWKSVRGILPHVNGKSLSPKAGFEAVFGNTEKLIKEVCVDEDITNTGDLLKSWDKLYWSGLVESIADEDQEVGAMVFLRPSTPESENNLVEMWVGGDTFGLSERIVADYSKKNGKQYKLAKINANSDGVVELSPFEAMYYGQLYESAMDNGFVSKEDLKKAKEDAVFEYLKSDLENHNSNGLFVEMVGSWVEDGRLDVGNLLTSSKTSFVSQVGGSGYEVGGESRVMIDEKTGQIQFLRKIDGNWRTAGDNVVEKFNAIGKMFFEDEYREMDAWFIDLGRGDKQVFLGSEFGEYAKYDYVYPFAQSDREKLIEEFGQRKFARLVIILELVTKSQVLLGERFISGASMDLEGTRTFGSQRVRNVAVEVVDSKERETEMLSERVFSQEEGGLSVEEVLKMATRTETKKTHKKTIDAVAELGVSSDKTLETILSVEGVRQISGGDKLWIDGVRYDKDGVKFLIKLAGSSLGVDYVISVNNDDSETKFSFTKIAQMKTKGSFGVGERLQTAEVSVGDFEQRILLAVLDNGGKIDNDVWETLVAAKSLEAIDKSGYLVRSISNGLECMTRYGKIKYSYRNNIVLEKDGMVYAISKGDEADKRIELNWDALSQMEDGLGMMPIVVDIAKTNHEVFYAEVRKLELLAKEVWDRKAEVREIELKMHRNYFAAVINAAKIAGVKYEELHGWLKTIFQVQ